MSDFQTPEIICNFMARLLPDGIVTVLEPTPGRGNLARALAGYQVTAPAELVIHLPRDIFPGFRVQTCILNMQNGFRGRTALRFWKENS